MKYSLIRQLVISMAFALFLPLWAGDLETVQRLSLDVSTHGYATTGEKMPFYLTANQHGVLSPDGSQGFLRAAGKYTLERRNIQLEGCVDGIQYASTHYTYFGHGTQLQQLYLKATWKSYSLTLGQRERKGGMVSSTLSSGNMVLSGNARPEIGIHLGTDRFVKMKIVANKAEGFFDIAYGKLADGHYNGHMYAKYQQNYGTWGENDPRVHNLIQNAWIHHVRAVIRSSTDYRFYAALGIEHAAMYGGKVNYVKQHDFQNFLLATMGAKGAGHRGVNAMFNHLISYNFRMKYSSRLWTLAAYRQIYADDLDSGIFQSGWDGLSGLELRLRKFQWMNHLVVEYIQSTRQGGVVYANDEYQREEPHRVYRTAGNSNYYHDEWYGGWANYGMALGNPLLNSPIYNNDGYNDFTMNMVRAIHAGCEGKLWDNYSYRILFTHSKTWGTPFAPLPCTRQNNSANLDVTYNWGYWNISGSAAYDHGTIMGNQWGFGLSFSRHFELRNW